MTEASKNVLKDHQSLNQWIMKVYIEQPLALLGYAYVVAYMAGIFFFCKKNNLNFSYILINFFQGNSIVIQWHITKSKPQPVNGGGPQGENMET